MGIFGSYSGIFSANACRCFHERILVGVGISSGSAAIKERLYVQGNYIEIFDSGYNLE